MREWRKLDASKCFAIMRGLLYSSLIVILSACGSNNSSSINIAKDLDVKAFRLELAKHTDAQLLDVRTPEEWVNGIIEGAILVNLFDQNFVSKIDSLDPSKAVFVYCKAGGRSKKAMDKMVALGFKEIYNLKGGYTAYRHE